MEVETFRISDQMRVRLQALIDQGLAITLDDFLRACERMASVLEPEMLWRIESIARARIAKEQDDGDAARQVSKVRRAGASTKNRRKIRTTLSV